MVDHVERVIELGWYTSFAGPLTYKPNTALRAAAARMPADRILVETDSPYLAPVPLARQTQPTRLRRRHARRCSPMCVESTSRTPMNSPPPTPPGSSAGSPAPGTRVRVIRLLASHGLSPNTDLGQHFLVDENLVDLSLREAQLTPDDVVLEVGAGVGVLTRPLAVAVGRSTPSRSTGDWNRC